MQMLSAEVARGFGLIRSSINSKVSQMEEYVSSIVSLLLRGALRLGSPLVGSAALDTYFVRAAPVLLPMMHKLIISYNLVFGLGLLRPTGTSSASDRYCNYTIIRN